MTDEQRAILFSAARNATLIGALSIVVAEVLEEAGICGRLEFADRLQAFGADPKNLVRESLVILADMVRGTAPAPEHPPARRSLLVLNGGRDGPEAA